VRIILAEILTSTLCFAVLTGAAQAQGEWHTYRGDTARTGSQPLASALSAPSTAANLMVQWKFPNDGDCPAAWFCPVAGFKASPIVVSDTVFVGSVNGYFYALEAATGRLKWRYPTRGAPPLLGSCDAGRNGDPQGGQSFGQYGIQSSATYAKIGGKDAIIFGAPDPNAESGLGSARLFALDLQTGLAIWKSDGVHDGSDVVAHVDGCNPGSFTDRHERLAYSSPLVAGNNVYVGIHNAADNPIQNGKIIAVDLSSGHVNPNFNYASTGGRGGGIWNSPAAGQSGGIYLTTGNTRIPPCMFPYRNCAPATEPSPNHGLSMLRLDKDTGNVDWAFQPVDFNHDGDPDWAAGAAIMSASCGELVASVQKDGWSYALDAGDGSMRWQFPPTGLGPSFLNDVHGDDDYKRPGAAWNDVLIITTGGHALTGGPTGGVANGYGRLHALNACATNEHDRVRWIADIPNSSGGGYSLGSPTVTGGIVFVGTDLGHLVVLGDPSVVPPMGVRCSNVEFATPSACTGAGFDLVPIPSVLRDVAMPDGGNIAGLRNEPALAGGRVFVGTLNGHVYMLDGNTGPIVTAVDPSSIVFGTDTHIRITGANFVAVQSVSPAADFVVNSKNMITAHILGSLRAGCYNIEVRTDTGVSDPPNTVKFCVTPIITGLNPTSGPFTGDTLVSVDGAGFEIPTVDNPRGTSFRVGSNDAATPRCSSTNCTISTPPGSPGVVDVTACVSGACSPTTSQDRFTYTGPTVTSFSPSHGPITGGTWVQIDGTSLAHDGSVQIFFGTVRALQWAGCPPIFFDDTCISALSPPHDAGPVPLSVRVAGGAPLFAGTFTYDPDAALTTIGYDPSRVSDPGWIELNGFAPSPDGAAVTLISSDPSAVVPPTPVTVSAGAWSAFFTLTFLPATRDETVTITATYKGSSARTTVMVHASPPPPPFMLSVAIGADALARGQMAPVTVTLNGSVPPNGAPITLASSDPIAIPVPSTVIIRPPNTTATFNITGHYSGRPKKVAIKATYNGVSASASLFVPTAPDPNFCTRCSTPEQCCVCNGGVWDRGRCE
jgi:outer membrane protein assembly factor BamB